MVNFVSIWVTGITEPFQYEIRLLTMPLNQNNELTDAYGVIVDIAKHLLWIRSDTMGCNSTYVILSIPCITAAKVKGNVLTLSSPRPFNYGHIYDLTELPFLCIISYHESKVSPSEEKLNNCNSISYWLRLWSHDLKLYNTIKETQIFCLLSGKASYSQVLLSLSPMIFPF